MKWTMSFVVPHTVPQMMIFGENTRFYAKKNVIWVFLLNYTTYLHDLENISLFWFFENVLVPIVSYVVPRTVPKNSDFARK